LDLPRLRARMPPEKLTNVAAQLDGPAQHPTDGQGYR
jgi:hypothetical protein